MYVLHMQLVLLVYVTLHQKFGATRYIAGWQPFLLKVKGHLSLAFLSCNSCCFPMSTSHPRVVLSTTAVLWSLIQIRPLRLFFLFSSAQQRETDRVHTTVIVVVCRILASLRCQTAIHWNKTYITLKISTYFKLLSFNIIFGETSMMLLM